MGNVPKPHNGRDDGERSRAPQWENRNTTPTWGATEWGLLKMRALGTNQREEQMGNVIIRNTYTYCKEGGTALGWIRVILGRALGWIRVILGRALGWIRVILGRALGWIRVILGVGGERSQAGNVPKHRFGLGNNQEDNVTWG